VDRGPSIAGELNQDFNAMSAAAFSVDVPDGYYGVSVTMGDLETNHEDMLKFTQGAFLNSVSTQPGQFVTNLYVFSVTGGRLVMTFAVLLNGRAAVNDLSFPWELSTRLNSGDLLTIWDIPTSFVIVQVRTTDTGGNSAISDAFTVELVPDHTPPAVRRVTPSPGAIAGSINLIGTYFSEPIEESTQGNSLSLAWAGSDDTFGTADDLAVGGGTHGSGGRGSLGGSGTAGIGGGGGGAILIASSTRVIPARKRPGASRKSTATGGSRTHRQLLRLIEAVA